MRQLLVAGLKSASASVLLAACGIVSAKILAVVLGPAGVGAFSLLRQALMSATVVASLNPQAPIAHAVARGERTSSTALQLSTAFWTISGSTLLVAGAGGLLAGTVLPQRAPVLAVMSAAVAANVLAVVLLAVLQAFRRIGAAGLAALAGGGATVGLAYPLAMLAAAGELAWLGVLLLVGPLASAAVATYFGWRDGWLGPALSRWRRFEASAGARADFLRIALAGLAAALAGVLALLAVRALVARDLGVEAAGVFDAAWTIGHGGFGMLLAAFGTHYLPTLIGASDSRARMRVVNQALVLLALIAAPASLAAIAMRGELVALLYSPEFRAAAPALFWIVSAQYLRFGGWALSFLALAGARMAYVAFADAAWSIGLVVAALGALPQPGALRDIGIAYLGLHALYLAFFLWYAWRVERVRPDARAAVAWLGGAACVAAGAWLLY
jgi:PST family polysaccharide transporter